MEFRFNFIFAGVEREFDYDIPDKVVEERYTRAFAKTYKISIDAAKSIIGDFYLTDGPLYDGFEETEEELKAEYYEEAKREYLASIDY